MSTDYSMATNNVTMKAFVLHEPTQRMFMGGSNGHIIEIKCECGWFASTKLLRQTDASASLISRFLPNALTK